MTTSTSSPLNAVKGAVVIVAYPRFKINPSAKELNELYTPTVYEPGFRSRASPPTAAAGRSIVVIENLSALTPAPRLLLKARQSGKGESLTPLADNLTRRIQPGRDHVIGEAFICEEDDFGADHITIR